MKYRILILLSLLAFALNTNAVKASSTRAAVNQSGVVTSTNDYYPFGKRWESSNIQAPNTRCLFSGKEQQTAGGINYMDFGSRMYDDFLGRWFAHDPMSESYHNLSPYAYCGNNPVIYTDPNGELFGIDDLVRFVVGGVIGGTINWISHGCKFNAQGLSYFGTGFVAGGMTALLPGSYAWIAGGLSATNSIMQQGYANGWNNIHFGQAIFDGGMGALTAYVGGRFSDYLGNTRLGGWVEGIKSPLLRNFIGSEMVGVPFGAVTGGLIELNKEGGSFWHGAWEGTKSAFVSSGISAIGTSIQYSYENKVNFITGKSTVKEQLIVQNNNTTIHFEEKQIERSILYDAVNDALQNPLKVTDVKYDAQGRPSVKYIGTKATVVVNPKTGKIVTTYSTSTQRLNKILKTKK